MGRITRCWTSTCFRDLSRTAIRSASVSVSPFLFFADICHSVRKLRMSWRETSWHTYGTTIYSTYVPFLTIIYLHTFVQVIQCTTYRSGWPWSRLWAINAAPWRTKCVDRWMKISCPHLFHRFRYYETCQRCSSSGRALENPFNSETFWRSSSMVLQGIPCFFAQGSTSTNLLYEAFPCGCTIKPSRPTWWDQDHQRSWQDYETWYFMIPPWTTC